MSMSHDTFRTPEHHFITRLILFFGIAAFLALAPDRSVGQVGTVGSATPPTKEVYCPRNGPPGTDYKSIILDISSIRVYSGEGDPGGDYELSLLTEASVYARVMTKHVVGGSANLICGVQGGRFYREFDIPELVKGRYFTFPMAARLVVHNVPEQSEVLLRIKLDEIDDLTGTDYAALDPTRPGIHDLYLVSFPFAEFTLVGRTEPRAIPNGMPFGQIRLVTGSGNDFPGGVVFRVTMKDQREITGAVSSTAGDSLPSAREMACRNYAMTSANQFRKAGDLGCNVQPPVWSDNETAHFQWCMGGQNDVLAKQALKDRDAVLASCGQSGDPDTACRAYADRSVVQFNLAKQGGCPYGPPVWSDDWPAHFSWCKAVGSAVATPELAKRDVALTQCGN